MRQQGTPNAEIKGNSFYKVKRGKYLRGSLSVVVALSMTSISGNVTPPSKHTQDFEILKYNNPGAVADLGVGLWAIPLPMDFDQDGDLDLLVSCPDVPFNGIYFFENKSGESIPVFEPPVRLTGSIKNIEISYVNGKERVLVPGHELINFRKSLGKEMKNIFPIDSIRKDFRKNPRFNQWKLVDYDGDGDEDLIIGVDDWSDYGWDNAYDTAGNWKNGPLHGYLYYIENVKGTYIKNGRLLAGGKQLDVYGAPSPNFADFDHDGDLDIVCGEFLDKLTWFENTGTRKKPVYTEGKYLKNMEGIIKMDLEMILPVAIDWNKDGFTDLVVGDEDGRVALIENTGKVKDHMPVFKTPVYFKQRADNVKFGALATPVGVDWDNDGDDDILSGNSAGYIGFIENLGIHKGSPKWAAPVKLKSDGKVIRIQAGNSGSMQGPAEAKWGYTTLSVADWDHDGKKDIIINSIWGKVLWFKNTGTAGKPTLTGPLNVLVDWETDAIPKPPGTWWTPEDHSLAAPWRTTPFAIDWNKDGLTDLIMLDTEGYLCLFERFNRNNQLWLKPGRRIFYGTNASAFNRTHVIEDTIPGVVRLNVEKFGRSGRRQICITDWNGDGALDLLVNSTNIAWMVNTGIKEGYVQLRNEKNVAGRILAGHPTSPTTVDWNEDGKPDLLTGAEDGHFYWLNNPY